MKPERWQLIERLFHTALQREESQRATYLEKACGGDESLRLEIERLLAQEAKAKDFLESPALELEVNVLTQDQVQSKVGRDLGSYKILSPLGRGGMGEVYLAQDTRLDRKVALKFLPQEMQQDSAAKQRFLREARSAAALDHPFICNIYETGEVEGNSFISMEYVQGETLKEKLASGPIALKELLVQAAEISEALEAAHRENIVHRDLKPANIMLTPDCHVKVMDFGLAKRLTPTKETDHQEETMTTLTRTGTTLGTLPYMSPEQLRGEEVDARSDIFSFGVVLYEMLTGTHPFLKDSPAETASAILSQVPPPITQYTQGVPDLLQKILWNMLSKDRDGRPQSIHDVGTSLKQLPYDLAPSEAGPGRRRRVALVAVALLLVGMMVVVINDRYFVPSPSPPRETVGLPLPEKPSIAVLPFVNMSGDPEEEYFNEGMAEDLRTDLSKIAGLFVIDRHSVSPYKGGPVDLEEVSRKLGVHFILQGSTRRTCDRVRINAQLVDVAAGGHLWADRYDRPLEDIFALQDEVAQKIVTALKVTLTKEEQERFKRAATDNLEAYDFYLRGNAYFNQSTKEANERAREMFEQALELDRGYAAAYAALGRTHWIDWFSQWSQDPPKSLKRASELAQRAIALDDSLPVAHLLLAQVHLWKKEHEQAVAEAERALTLDPNSADVHANLGNILAQIGRPEQGVEMVKRAMRLNPHLPFTYFIHLGVNYCVMGRFEEAIAAQKQALIRNPNSLIANVCLAACSGNSGRTEEARAAAAEVLRINPDFSLKTWGQRVPRKEQALQQMIRGLRLAGLE